MDNGGQLSADFLFATLILIIILGALTNIVSSGIDTAQNSDISKAKVLADSISRSINTVYSDGDGQFLVVQLPYDYFGNSSQYSYTITVNSSGVIVQYKNRTVISPIIPKDNITCSPVTINPLSNVTNNLTIKNNNGIVIIS